MSFLHSIPLLTEIIVSTAVPVISAGAGVLFGLFSNRRMKAASKEEVVILKRENGHREPFFVGDNADQNSINKGLGQFLVTEKSILAALKRNNKFLDFQIPSSNRSLDCEFFWEDKRVGLEILNSWKAFSSLRKSRLTSEVFDRLILVSASEPVDEQTRLLFKEQFQIDLVDVGDGNSLEERLIESLSRDSSSNAKQA